MKRLAVLSVVMGMILMVVAAPVGALVPAVSVSPGSGSAGSSVTVSVSGFTPSSTFEVRAGSFSGGLLASGTTNGSGAASAGVTIPGGAPDGGFTLAVCETEFVACADTGHEFWVGASTTFTVTTPPTVTVTIPTPTPTVTVPPLDLGPDYTPPGVCAIPANAIVLDFDDVSTGPITEFGDTWRRLEWDQFYLSQADHYDVSLRGTRESVDRPPITETLATIDANPSRDLTTSSPPHVLRIFDEGHFSVKSHVVVGQMDYFGFNVGFGHFGEGFERPETVVLDVSIRMLPVHETDGTVAEAAWAPVTVTLGPGPQPVDTCVLLNNTAGAGHPLNSTWLIDIYPRHLDGTSIHVPIDIDDVFYGSDSPAAVGCAVPAGADVVDFDSLPSGWSRWDETFAPLTTSSGNLFRFGFYDHITETTGGAGVPTLPYRTTDVGIGSVAPGTVSPPKVAVGEGHLEFTIDQGVDYVGLHMGWPVSDSIGVLALFAEAGSVRMDITARSIPVHQLDGTVFSAELARTALELGPDFTPIDHCVVLDLSTVDMHPTFDSVIVEIAASYRGVPNDWRTVIDDVFFGSGPAPTTTDVTLASTASTASVSPTTVAAPPSPAAEEEVPDTESGALVPVLLALGGLIIAFGAGWWARKHR